MTDRINREIDDLLRHIEARERRSVTRRFQRWSHGASESWHNLFGGFLRRSPVEQFMIASIVLLMVSLVVQNFSRTIAGYASILSILLFVLALVISVTSPGRGGYQKRWRGRIIDYSQPTIWTHIRRWFNRRR
ncbi:MAG TPA: hypothetical protein VHX16_16340 [Chloroflexota bacterium]|jgi:hypothetical protein|nr:hypothetical protein [Chloroflexota bacterium]